MRKYISIVFLSIYLFTFVQVSELFKIPLLLAHFTEHQLRQTDLSLKEFIEIHYMKGEVADDDHNRDMELPFKSITSNLSLSTISCPVILEYNFAFSIFDQKSESQKFTKEVSFSSNYLSTIWQPPQFS